jgi:hypothetical protein
MLLFVGPVGYISFLSFSEFWEILETELSWGKNSEWWSRTRGRRKEVEMRYLVPTRISV